MSILVDSHALEAWLEEQKQELTFSKDVQLRNCVVTNFKSSFEIVFEGDGLWSKSLILSAYNPKNKYFQEPDLSDLSDPIRHATRIHARELATLFYNRLIKSVAFDPGVCELYLRHMEVVFSEAHEVTVISADRCHLSLLAWYPTEKSMRPSTHTYDISRLLVAQKHLAERDFDDPKRKAQIEAIRKGFLALLQDRIPTRRTLASHSFLAYASRIMVSNPASQQGLLDVSYEDQSLNIGIPEETVSIHLKLVDDIPSDLQGNYDTLKAYQELHDAVTAKEKKNHDRVWHFLRLSMRFNSKPAKRALAYSIGPHSAVFYHPMEDFFVQVVLRY